MVLTDGSQMVKGHHGLSSPPSQRIKKLAWEQWCHAHTRPHGCTTNKNLLSRTR